MSKWVVEEKRLREAFINARATDTTVAGGGGVVWVEKQVRKYDKAIRRFREHLLVLAT